MAIPEAPCKDCKNRILGCHSKCKEYLKFKVDLEKFKKQKLVESQYDRYEASMRAVRYKINHWKRKDE